MASMLAASLAHADADRQMAREEEVIVTATHAVTATKTDTPLVEIPQSISIVTDQQIRDQGALTMQDSLQYTPGVTNAGDDSRGDFNTIRSFLSEQYLDGLKRNFGFIYLPRSEVYTLDRIDVLLGPSAVLYGAGSSGGLVNLESKRPRFDFGGEVGASFGSYNRKQAQFDVYGALNDTMAARLVGVYRDSNMMIGYLPDDRTVLQPSFTWKPDDRTQVTLIGLYQRDYTGPSQNFVPLVASLYAPAGRKVDASTLLGEPYFNKGPKQDGELTLLVDHAFNDWAKVKSSTRIAADNTSYGEIYGTWDQSDVLHPFIDQAQTTIARALFAYQAHYRSVDTDDSLELNFRNGPVSNQVLLGIDYSWFHQLAKQAYGGATPINIYNPVYGAENIPDWFPETRQVLKDTGLYAQDQIRYQELATLVLGVRHDHVSTSNTGLDNEIDSVTTYRAGLTLNVGHEIYAYASYAESFQPVSGLNQFNQSFKPLFGKAYEGGVKWQPLRGTLLRVAYYDITENNHLTADPNNPLNSIQAGSVKARGVEFQADHRVASDITITAGYSHNSAKLSGQDRQEDNVPEDTAALFATKTMIFNGGTSVRFGGGVRYVGKQIAGDKQFLQVVTPGYTVVDGLLAVDHDRWSLQLNAVNLFDHDYYSLCSQFGYCENGERRTYNAAVTYRLQ
jgi:iron complex outermembrane recepter protein